MIPRPILYFLLGAFATVAGVAAEFSNAAQPQLAAGADGRVWVAFGRNGEILVAPSNDGGETFATPARVAALPSLQLGRRRGPRIVAHGDTLTVTVMAGDFFAFRSKDAGKTWTGPVPINDVPRAAREGLHALAVAPDGHLFATWLDLRGTRMQLFSSESADGGATWSANQLVYRAPEGDSICECCHPSALYDARGDLTVMWRNAVGGARDMWTATRPAGSTTFGPPAKLGEGTWVLKACPMDGGLVFSEGDRFATIWQREGAVFFARRGEPEKKLAAGTQPVAVATPGASLALWQQGTDLFAAELSGESKPQLFARGARFASVLAVPPANRILVAYERGPDVVVIPADRASR